MRRFLLAAALALLPWTALAQSAALPGETASNPDPVEAYGPKCGNPCVIRAGDGGGYIHRYVFAADAAAGRRQRFVLDAPCYSACTMMVERLASAGLACATSRGAFRVHQGFREDGSRFPVEYGAVMAAVVAMKGGQPTEGWLRVEGRDLELVVPRCRPGPYLDDG